MTATTSRQPLDFETFYARARDGCLRAVVVSTGDRHAADDLVAEAFARAWARWPAVRRHPAPEAWVVRTALNLRVSWWRRLRREVPALDDDERDLVVGRRTGDERGPEDRLDLLAAVADLPERQRQVLALRVFLDLDTRETAEALGIAEGTVTAHLHRATSTLRTRLTDPLAPTPRSKPSTTTTSSTACAPPWTVCATSTRCPRSLAGRGCSGPGAAPPAWWRRPWRWRGPSPWG